MIDERKGRAVVAISVVLMFMVSCAHFTENAYRTLTVSKQTYTITLSALGDLYKQGQITEEQKAKVIQLSRAYKHAHNKAAMFLLDYETSKAESDKQRYIEAATAVSTRLVDLLEYIEPFIKGGE